MAQLPIAIKATAEQERLERQATEDLTAALQKWAAALLRNVNSFNLNTMLDRLNNPRWAGNIAMRDALIAIMQRAAEVGVDAGVEALYSGNATKAQPVIDAGGVDWELVNVDAAEWALNYSHLLMNDISSTTRRAIQREIAYYVENSMTINQLRDRIMSLSTFSETRANRIAVTETTRAYAEGNMRAWSDLDYVERVRWQTANDDLVCPICGPLNQQTVAKGELFAGRYYSPPAHVNCRCGVSPVVTGAEEAGAGAGAPLSNIDWATQNDIEIIAYGDNEIPAVIREQFLTQYRAVAEWYKKELGWAIGDIVDGVEFMRRVSITHDPNGFFAGFAGIGENGITINTALANDIRGTIIHEWAHRIQNELGLNYTGPETDIWGQLIDTSNARYNDWLIPYRRFRKQGILPTAYAEADSSEGWAESVEALAQGSLHPDIISVLLGLIKR